jgi:fumarate reductase subunit D
MNDLNRALLDITNIRRQVARSTKFHGYGPATLAATGVLAVIAATAQAFWLPDPARHMAAYLSIWIATAILSATVIAIQMFTRTRRIHSAMADEMLHMAAEQFLPSVAAGALLTVVLQRFVPNALWMLPGLWQIVFSLGIFASCRFLPRAIFGAGAWYLLTGLLCLTIGDARALSPWAMGIPYAAGQLLIAAILLVSTREAAVDL